MCFLRTMPAQIWTSESLGDVVDLFTNMDMGDTEGNREDLLGRTYEYCIQLSSPLTKRAKGGGEFYTPASIVKTLVAILKPDSRTAVYMTLAAVQWRYVRTEREVYSGTLW